MNKLNRLSPLIGSLLLLFLGVSPHVFGQDKGWILNIEIPNARTLDQAPAINPNQQPPVQPTMDPQSGRWFVPINRKAQEFVSSYVVEARDKNVIAVQLSVPPRLIRENQYVYLAPSTIRMVDESSVSQLWSANRIMSEPSDAKTQFGYLQDLLYINRTIMEEQQRAGQSHRVNAMSLRAAYMLLQVVRNLAENTWYVIDPETQEIIRHARAKIGLGGVEDRYCRWLGRAVCRDRGAQKLDETVKALDSARFARMYTMLVPERTKLDKYFCSDAKIQNLKDFWLYFSKAHSGESRRTGLSEGRLLNDLVACQVTRALCVPKDRAKIIEELGAAKALLEEADSPDTQARLREVSMALEDITTEKPAKCPARS